MTNQRKIDDFFNGDIPPATASDKQDNRHSRLVRRAKLLLPAVAALLIGLLLLFPSLKPDKEFNLDITLPKKGELEKLHIENTTFYITDQENQVNNFTADNIDETSPGSKLIKLNKPQGIIPVSDTTWIDVSAPTGFYNQTDNTLQLTENVEMVYSDGMTIDVPDMLYEFRKSFGHSDKNVTGRGHLGDVDSQGFEFYKDKALLIFTGKTHIIIKQDKLESD